MLPLSALGRRIVILGPSNAGKSTLALAIARRLDVPAIHLDQYRHLPDTDWLQRPDDEFAALHDAAIMGENWVMEGNYSSLMPQRFARATGAILVTSHHWLRFGRYLKRTLFNRHNRAGHLQGARDSLKWEMVQWVLIRTRNSHVKYARMIRESGLPAVECHTARALDDLYRTWGLQRRR